MRMIRTKEPGKIRIIHNKKLLYVILALIIILIILGYYLNNLEPKEKLPGVCYSTSDCAPSSCCHASSCTLKTDAPNCTGIKCSQECVSNTLDCQQASCICQSGECAIQQKSSGRI